MVLTHCTDHPTRPTGIEASDAARDMAVGDVLECGITHLGAQRHVIVD